MKRERTTLLLPFVLIFGVAVVGLCQADPVSSDSMPASDPPNLIHRAEWGAKPPTGPYQHHEIKTIAIHHQGVFAGPNQDARRRLRTMQAFHQSKKRGFVDIAYHFIIDRNGNLYEGRPVSAPGETRTDYNPNGHLLICLLGDFNVQEPTEQQLSTVTALIQWSLLTFHLSRDAVKGHRDFAHTDCPGKNLYRLLQNEVLFKSVQKGAL
jgi:hypothetical protein